MDFEATARELSHGAGAEFIAKQLRTAYAAGRAGGIEEAQSACFAIADNEGEPSSHFALGRKHGAGDCALAVGALAVDDKC